MANKLIVSLSPHVHSGDSVQKNMYGVIIALVPALLVSFYMFGLGAVIVTLTSVIACRKPVVGTVGCRLNGWFCCADRYSSCIQLAF